MYTTRHDMTGLSGFVSGSGGAASPPPSSGALADEMKRLFTRSPTAAGATSAADSSPNAAEGAPVPVTGSAGGMKWPSLSPKAKNGGI